MEQRISWDLDHLRMAQHVSDGGSQNTVPRPAVSTQPEAGAPAVGLSHLCREEPCRGVSRTLTFENHGFVINTAGFEPAEALEAQKVSNTAPPPAEVRHRYVHLRPQSTLRSRYRQGAPVRRKETTFYNVSHLLRNRFQW